ncbi:uncharacterized protein EI90DRAFT_3041941 [Cantharellus anzutake]|uniref:uncharacterized protein n=1 Tax=Cantharellus anzutake TaxID=1750568 RepID=UPI001903A25D|nr:uncharacterized protein EI90DRAFT_3041941 [Cantharellus anzutake]KAF8338175.1 hypothetical protein EI90DRAFT_3041941 [Cantharellus anzutake]
MAPADGGRRAGKALTRPCTDFVQCNPLYAPSYANGHRYGVKNVTHTRTHTLNRVHSHSATPPWHTACTVMDFSCASLNKDPPYGDYSSPYYTTSATPGRCPRNRIMDPDAIAALHEIVNAQVLFWVVIAFDPSRMPHAHIHMTTAVLRTLMMSRLWASRGFLFLNVLAISGGLLSSLLGQSHVRWPKPGLEDRNIGAN